MEDQRLDREVDFNPDDPTEALEAIKELIDFCFPEELERIVALEAIMKQYGYKVVLFRVKG